MDLIQETANEKRHAIHDHCGSKCHTREKRWCDVTWWCDGCNMRISAAEVTEPNDEKLSPQLKRYKEEYRSLLQKQSHEAHLGNDGEVQAIEAQLEGVADCINDLRSEA